MQITERDGRAIWEWPGEFATAVEGAFVFVLVEERVVGWVGLFWWWHGDPFLQLWISV